MLYAKVAKYSIHKPDVSSLSLNFGIHFFPHPHSRLQQNQKVLQSTSVEGNLS